MKILELEQLPRVSTHFAETREELIEVLLEADDPLWLVAEAQDGWEACWCNEREFLDLQPCFIV